VPVDVEKILWRFKLDLVPLPSLKEDDDVDALLLGDLTAIVIDQKYYMDNRKQTRVRFSIAHELGHFILHKGIYQEIAYASEEEWIEFVQTLPEDQYSFIEFHANEFAGRLLVPVERLKQELKSAIAQADKAGITAWDQFPYAGKEYVATRLSRVFGVSSEVIEKRFDREKLWPPK
jgi:Zn-dependent peptidase ImmA (M78 family)